MRGGTTPKLNPPGVETHQRCAVEPAPTTYFAARQPTTPLLFSIKAGKDTIQAEGLTHESALTAYLMKRRRPLISTRNPANADLLFSDLPKKAMVSGGGASKAYKIKWEKVGGKRSRFPGARYVFSVDESRLGRLFSFR